jgi:hypothetical protein
MTEESVIGKGIKACTCWAESQTAPEWSVAWHAYCLIRSRMTGHEIREQIAFFSLLSGGVVKQIKETLQLNKGYFPHGPQNLWICMFRRDF